MGRRSQRRTVAGVLIVAALILVMLTARRDHHDIAAPIATAMPNTPIRIVVA